MAAKYTNEASLIVAQAIIESAQLYVETLEDLKKQIEKALNTLSEKTD